MHLAWRWFTGLGFDQEIPHHSTFSKNRHGRPREQLAEAAQVHHTMRQYLLELEQQNPVEEPVHRQDQVSTTDPDSTYATKAWYANSAGLLRQLSGGQSKLRDCGSAGNGGAHEPGNRGRATHAHPFREMARTRTRIGCGRYHIRKWGVLAMVGGSEHHSVFTSTYPVNSRRRKKRQCDPHSQTSCLNHCPRRSSLSRVSPLWETSCHFC